MKENRIHLFLLIITTTLLIGCNKDHENSPGDCVNSDFFSEYSSRNFEMCFSTWAYTPTIESVDTTYLFISKNADVYSEHIDYKIPWKAWINGLPLPVEFTDEITTRSSRRIETSSSVSSSVSSSGVRVD